MNENGDIGFVERKSGSPCAGDLVVIAFARGNRMTIAAPHAGVKGLPGSQFIADLRIADDGSLFVTLSAFFSGAYSGISERVFSWSGAVWREHDVTLPERYTDLFDNRSIGAVESRSRFGVVGDFGDATGFDYDAHDHDPTYYMPESGIADNGLTTSLGVGTITAMRGQLTVGYLHPYGWCEQGGFPTAVRWYGGKKRLLGPGVAFAVDATGVAVGSDRAVPAPTPAYGGRPAKGTCDDAGHPILWKEQFAIQMSSLPGSALAIRSGTIVGTVDGRAFVTHASESDRRLHYLDDLVAGDWKITNAFAIDGRGRILAIGARSGSPSGLLILEPAR